MDNYEKRQDAYDRFFDRGIDQLDNFSIKIDDDMHPDKKIKLYKELIDRAHAFYMECLAKESADSELYHNSNEAYSQYEYYQKEYEDFISRYDEELAEWEEDQEVKKEEQKCKRMIAQSLLEFSCKNSSSIYGLLRVSKTQIKRKFFGF